MVDDREMLIWVAVLAAAIFVAILICFFVYTKGNRLYKKMVNPQKTVGWITEKKWFDGDDVPTVYQYDYSFQDNRGMVRENSFKTKKDLGEKGGSITIYYDLDDPQSNVAEEYLMECRSNYWKYPLAVLLFILPFLIIVLVLHIKGRL
ncbi:MAG: DUF3592 domain-containing protein [Clostridium sp.]|nr:DUF3592 domain-containing protein [Clostridium sp.]MCM1208674.1 DUF3592 domain-containing protein [Ruminococcus sp.]